MTKRDEEFLSLPIRKLWREWLYTHGPLELRDGKERRKRDNEPFYEPEKICI
jgi:hypothetical protein